MALFSMRVQVIKRSAGRSVVAAAAYRSGERLYDQRQGMTHDYSRRGDVELTELMLPADAPEWVKGISREDFWNCVDAFEKRKDAQTAREIRLMIPRELPPAERVALVRDYVARCFVSRGMVADICFHNKVASDGLENVHAHVMLTMRPLTSTGFGPKSRHDWVAHPSGQRHPDGKPVMIESNPDSYNSAAYYEHCREAWEKTANDALARIGSEARIDRRSLVERGLARMPEPALRLAFHLKELRGVMKERFGQFQYAKHYQAVEKRSQAAFKAAEPDPVAAIHAGYESGGRGRSRDATPAQKVARFYDWFTRQIERLSPKHDVHDLTPAQERAPPQSPPNLDLER